MDSRQLMRAAQEVFADSFVSVVMPTYNQAAFLPEALASVLGQSHRNLQVIVVDDGSTDETAHLLKAICDPRVEVVRHRGNRGLPAALNTGFGRIRGRFATWTSSDNLMRPHCIAELLRSLRQDPQAGLAHGNYRYFGTQEGIGDTSEVTPKSMYYLGRAIGPAFLLRTALLAHLPEPPFDETLQGIEDTAFALELRRLARFAHVAQVLYDYRYHALQITEGIVHAEGYRPLVQRMQDRYDKRHRPTWQISESVQAGGALRVLYVYPHCCHGGVEVVLLNRVRALQALGIHSEVCFGQDVGGARMFAGVCPCHVLSQPEGPLAVGELSKLVRDRRYEVVTLISYPLAYQALADAGFQGALVCECHGNLQLTDVPGAQTADLVLAVSTRLRTACRRCGIRVPVRALGNAVDIERFGGGGPEAGRHDSRFAVSPKERVVAFTGRLGE